jgi:hypothetical protein
VSLRELQGDLRAALLGGDDAAACAEIRGDGLDPSARLALYRHHVTTTLTAALQATFPVVCRLVDERFFAFAADRYIAIDPPSGPCLFEYGARFPEFLAGFGPCAGLPYLPDVARLEWALERAWHAPDAAPLPMTALAGLAPDVAGGLGLGLDPSVTYLDSPFAIDRIWHANRPGTTEPEIVDAGASPVCLEVRRHGEDAEFRALDAGVFAFRRVLAGGRDLGHAALSALAADPDFDLAAALRALFAEELAVAIVTPSHPGEPPCPSQP